MSQRAKTPSFTFNELIIMVLRPIPISQTKSLLLYGRTTKHSTIFAFYMDDIFGTFENLPKAVYFSA